MVSLEARVSSGVDTFPTIGDGRIVGGNAVFVRTLVVVRMSWRVDDDRVMFGNTLEAVHHPGRNRNQNRVISSHAEFVDVAEGGGVFALIVQYGEGHSLDHRPVVGLQLVVVPAFDNAGICCGHIDLAELLEDLVIATQDLHESTALIWDDFERFNEDAVDSVARCTVYFRIVAHPFSPFSKNSQRV